MTKCKGKYPNKESAALTKKMEAETPPIAEDGTGTAVMPCPKEAGGPSATTPSQSKKKDESSPCRFDGVSIEKSDRNYMYHWTVDTPKGWSGNEGVTKDLNGNNDNVFEVTGSTEKPAKVNIKKLGFTTPSGTCNHKKKPWDVEGCPEKNELGECVLAIKPTETTFDQWVHFYALNVKPHKQRIKALSCDGKRDLNIHCYPDTKLELKIQYNGLNAKGPLSLIKDKSDKYTPSPGGEGKLHSGGITLSVYRGGELQDQVGGSYDGHDPTKEPDDPNKPKEKKDNRLALEKQLDDLYANFKWATKLFNALNGAGSLEKFSAVDDRDKNNIKTVTHKNIGGSWNVKLLHVDCTMSAQWEELKNSRHCAFHQKISLSLAPLVGFETEFDLNYAVFGAIPQLGLAIKAVDGFLQALEAGEVGIRFKVEGDISMSTDWDWYKVGPLPPEKNLKVIELTGGVICTLRAVARVNVNAAPKLPSIFEMSVGAAAHGELGTRAGFRDSNHVYATLKAIAEGDSITRAKERAEEEKQEKGRKEKKKPWYKDRNLVKNLVKGAKKLWRDKIQQYDQQLKQFAEESSRQTGIYYDPQGNLKLRPRVGFTGLEIYTIGYVEIGAKMEVGRAELDIPVDKGYKGKAKKTVFNKNYTLGSKEPKPRALIMPRVVVTEAHEKEFTIWSA